MATVTFPSSPAGKDLKQYNSVSLRGEAAFTHVISRAKLCEWETWLYQDYMTLDKVPDPSVPQIPHQQSENTNSICFKCCWDD